MSKENRIGALWEGTTSKGQLYFSGSIKINGEDTKIVVFKNNKRPDKKDPDWQILLSKPREESQSFGTTFEDDDLPPF